MAEVFQKEKTRCYHCGESCKEHLVEFDEKPFCCDGCRFVYELLSENNLCTYYQFDEKSGVAPKTGHFNNRFAFLDDSGTVDKLISFKDEKQSHVTFFLPQMHCSSCVWLLEHLYRLNPGISHSRTDFLKKEISLGYDHHKTSLRKVVELLTTIGYEPQLNLDNLEKQRVINPQKKRVYRIAVAGFCFANIMMLSFPEYFHIGEGSEASMQKVFSYLNLFLSLPVLIYSGGEFFESAYAGIKAKFLNIDIPLVLSIIITFSRSLYEIISGSGAGYLDSMSGIIFFMLIGRYFQERTTQTLQFDRNFKSYFPIFVTIPGKKEDTTIPLSSLKIGQHILVRSQELIPADAKLLSGDARIDYSFVTGESEPIPVKCGDTIYAGGKQTRGVLELEVLKEVSQSYLTSLWNRQPFKQEKTDDSYIHKVAKHFTIFLLLLSIGALIYWLPIDPSRGMNALTTVLIVACPCALLLSATFTNGAVMRIFSKNGLYLKHPNVIESLSKTSHLVFDKTGTITLENSKVFHFEGHELTETELTLAFNASRQSNHPLSKIICQQLSFCESTKVAEFSEIPGSGITAKIANRFVRLGSGRFIHDSIKNSDGSSMVHFELDGQYMGYFQIGNIYRPELQETIGSIKEERIDLSLISGDHDGEKNKLQSLFGVDVSMKFEQSPINKLEYISELQMKGAKVLMVGDGLNDAGALKQSNTGIAVSDNVNNFSPACDAIMEGKSFKKLPRFLVFSKTAQKIIIASFIISLLYNLVGLSFAVRGQLEPVIAAILMPISSITIILFTTGSSHFFARRQKLD